MWSRIVPVLDDDGEVVLVGKKGQSVDVQDIEERFKALKITGITWHLLHDLRRVRNDIEHYYTNLPRERLRQSMAGTFHLIQQFCLPYLDMHPVDFIGNEYWEFLTEEDAFFTEELKECHANLNQVTWPLTALKAATNSMHCLKCESPLIRAVDPKVDVYMLEFSCTKCGEVSGYEPFVEAALLKHFEGANYQAVMDGCDFPLETCFACGMETWVVSEAKCAACLSVPEHTECWRCGNGLSVAEFDLGGLCGYCNNVRERVMRE